MVEVDEKCPKCGNENLKIFQNIFNHAYPSLTMRYIGINQDMIDEAVSDFAL